MQCITAVSTFFHEYIPHYTYLTPDPELMQRGIKFVLLRKTLTVNIYQS